MATLSGGFTMLDLAKKLDPKGDIAPVVNVLSTREELFRDAKFYPANGKDSHTYIQAMNEPTGTPARFNTGIPGETARTKAEVERIVGREARSTIDKRILDRAGGQKARVRSDQDRMFIQGMTKQITADFFYGSAGDPEVFTGLGTRQAYNALAREQVIGGGGTGDDTMSMYLVRWAEDGCHFRYPEGDPNMGIKREDKGEQKELDAVGNPFWVYETVFSMYAALVIPDDEAVVRIANVESAGSTNTFDFSNFITALSRLRNLDGVVMYTNKVGWAQIWNAASEKVNVEHDPNDPVGRPLNRLAGIPVRITEQLLITETAIA